MLRFIPRSDVSNAAPLMQAGIPEPLALLMAQRGVHTPEAARAFLAPHPDQLLDPMRLRDMDRAVRALRQAVERGERITIYGDYDVDGVTATALLHEALEACGARVAYYIPSRHEEGYGLNREALDRLRETTDLLVTVDCGITAVEEVAYAYGLGMRVIVTDHHEAPAELPVCEAVVNPLLGDYPFRRLCGAGVAFKLAQALRGWQAVQPLLPLVALATVADLVPLLEENRVLTALGLQALQTDERPGLRALIEVAGLADKTVTAGHLGFQIGPRLNAGGRLKHAAQNVALLLTGDMGEAREIAQALNAENALRQRLEQKTFEAADAWVSKHVDFLEERALVVVGEGWNHGVIGLAASRLVEKYHYPTVVLCQEGDQCVGSARSIPAIHIHQALSSCAALFTRFGGHSQAAGMTLPAASVPEFRRQLSQAIRVQEGPDTFLPSERYDAVLTLDALTVPLLQQLEALAPHGMGNPAPTFCLRGAQVLTARAVGQDQSHLRMRLAQGGAQADAIAFRQAGWLERLPERLDALIRPGLNTWQGRSELSCQVEKLQPHAPEETFVQQCKKDRVRFERAILARMAYNKDLQSSVQVHALSRAQLWTQLEVWLSTQWQGVLLIAETLEAVRHTVEHLHAKGLAQRLEYCLGVPEDARAFHALCAAPNLAALETRYQRIVFLDGVPAQQDALLVRAVCPDATLLADGDAGAWLDREVARITPSDAQMRALYRALRDQHGVCRALAALSEGSGLPEGMVLAGLTILDELKLATWREEPFEAVLMPMRRRALTESGLLVRMRARAGAGETMG